MCLTSSLEKVLDAAAERPLLPIFQARAAKPLAKSLPEAAVCGTYFELKTRTTGPSADPSPTRHSRSRQPMVECRLVLSDEEPPDTRRRDTRLLRQEHQNLRGAPSRQAPCTNTDRSLEKRHSRLQARDRSQRLARERSVRYGDSPCNTERRRTARLPFITRPFRYKTGTPNLYLARSHRPSTGTALDTVWKTVLFDCTSATSRSRRSSGRSERRRRV